MRKLERPVPRAQAVADALSELVHERRLVPGDKLPSETELLEMLGVGRSSVREGIQLLESLGIVEVEQGKGTFLASGIGGGLQRVIDWAYPSSSRGQLLADLIDARIMIEGTQARLASERASDDEIRQFAQAFAFDARTDAATSMTAETAEAEGHEYHHAIARMAHNEVLLILSNAVRVLHASLITGGPVNDLRTALEHHAEITAAIIRRDADAAETAMRTHLVHNRQMFERWIGERERPKHSSPWRETIA
jgi:GntR family transcriptional repressor for pyruvate dehydrogenase complex